jgi:apolipoprotein N-acyltransferase
MFAEEFFDIQYQLSKKAMLEHPDFDLLLWAETMWPLPAIEEGQNGEIRRPWPGEEDELLDMQLMERLQRETVSYLMALAPDDAHFMTGSHFYAVAIDGQHSERSTDFLLFNKSGELLQHASKRLLVPFGEILPFNNRFPGATWICDLAQSQFGLRPDFVVSEQVGPFQSRGQLPSLGGAVCWENVFESPFREQADSGASAFVILSNEDWLGSDGLEMTQMVSATKFRAAETGRHVVRATNTGISCRVSPSGAVAAGPAIGERGYWLTELPIIEAKYQTNYQRMGWMLAPIWLVVCLIVLVVNILCKRSLDLSPKNK